MSDSLPEEELDGEDHPLSEWSVQRVELGTRAENFGTVQQRLRAIAVRVPRGRWYPEYSDGATFPTSLRWEAVGSRV